MCITLPVCSTSLPHFNKAWQNTVHYEGNYAPIFHCLALNKKQHSWSTARHKKNSLTKSHSTKFTNHHESKPKPSNILQLIENVNAWNNLRIFSAWKASSGALSFRTHFSSGNFSKSWSRFGKRLKLDTWNKICWFVGRCLLVSWLQEAEVKPENKNGVVNCYQRWPLGYIGYIMYSMGWLKSKNNYHERSRQKKASITSAINFSWGV